MKNLPLSAGLTIVTLLAALAAPAFAKSPLDPKRIDAIAAMLPAQPRGLGQPIADRTAWDKLAALPLYKDLLRRAEKINSEPIPEQSDDLYLIYSKTGSRDEWQKVAFDRRLRVQELVLAECLINRGAYLPRIKEYVGAICGEKTWLMPAHDHGQRNFNGQAVDIDLGSSALGWQLATASWLLGDKLDAATRTLIKDNIQRRIVAPYHARCTGEEKPFFWMTCNHNWNSVCHAGTVGAALASADDRHTRAEFIAGAEYFIKNYLAGFTPDGYCVEGPGYWNYGFGNYMKLAETIRQATGGKVDLLANPALKAPALFGERIQIINGVAPAIADCHVYPRPEHNLMYYVNRLFDLGLKGYDTPDTKGTSGLAEEVLFRFPNAASAAPNPSANAGYELRSWFKDAGVLICRPTESSASHFGVAIKGGHNAGNHSHIDTGSYTVVANNHCVILDPGGERYTARTFSSHRFDSKLLNSYGHDVPLVAGQQERPGADAAAKVLKTDFTDAADTIVLDITSCYKVPSLKKMERTFVYSRQGRGSLTVTDHATFSTPQSFGTALITLGKYTAAGESHLELQDEKDGVSVAIAASGPTQLTPEIIREKAPVEPTRLGINLTETTKDARITLTITPR